MDDQTTYDLVYWVIPRSASIESAPNEDSLANTPPLNFGDAATVFLEKPAPAWFRTPPRASSASVPQLIACGDDGYNALGRSSTAGRFYVVYGIPIGGDVSWTLRATHADLDSRKMKRVERTSLEAEDVSLATSIDCSCGVRDVVAELLYDTFGYNRFNELKPSPLGVPFDFYSAVGSPQQEDTKSFPPRPGCSVCVSGASNKSLRLAARDSANVFSEFIHCKAMRRKYELPLTHQKDAENREAGLLIRTDNANAISAAHASNARRIDRLQTPPLLRARRALYLQPFVHFCGIQPDRYRGYVERCCPSVGFGQFGEHMLYLFRHSHRNENALRRAILAPRNGVIVHSSNWGVSTIYSSRVEFIWSASVKTEAPSAHRSI